MGSKCTGIWKLGAMLVLVLLSLGVQADPLLFLSLPEGAEKAFQDAPGGWVPLLDNATLGAIELQAFPAGQPDQGRSFETGLSRPFHQRPLQDSGFAFPLSLAPDQAHETFAESPELCA